jgi:general secretion pathway protein M
MKQLPEGPQGQALALVVAALAVVVLYLLVISPVLAFYGEREDQLDRRLAMAGRYEVLARELPALRAADRTWRDQEGGELLLEGSSDAIASAALQAVMKKLVEDAGARLSSSEVLQPAANGNFRRVGIRVAFSGDLKLVTAVLRGVETSRPILSVGDFSLRSGNAAVSGDENTAAGDSGPLSVTLDVYGFRAPA